jgi:hypothetical protein
MSLLRCDHCGALASIPGARCRYCGSPTARSDRIIAASFGSSGATWEVSPPVDKTNLALIDGRELCIDLPARPEVPGPVMSCAWTRGAFVDVDVSSALVFDGVAPGLAAGFLLRSADPDAIWVALHPNGSVTAEVRRGRDAEKKRTVLLSEFAKAPLVSGTPTVLRAVATRDLLSLFVDGAPLGSARCPADMNGTVDLFVQVADEERARVRFVDPCAALP